MLKPEFTRRVDLGHVIQAAMMLLTVGGAGGGLYLSLQSQIAAQAVEYATLQQQVIEQQSSIRQIQDDQRRLTENIDSNLSKLGDELADVRVLVAKNAHVR